MIKLIQFTAALVGVFWMALAGGYAVHWWDNRAAGTPSINVPLPLGLHWRWTAPDSLGARLAAVTRADAQATAVAQTRLKADATLSVALVNQNQATQKRIQTVTKEIVRYVPQIVTPADDSHCVVPVGFVRVFNAAASGKPVPVPTAASAVSDATPSGVSLSTVAEVTTQNDGVALSTAARLTALQAWVRGVTGTPPP